MIANMYMLKAFGVELKINEACKSKDIVIKSMVEKMKTKYMKYQGDHDILNILLLIVVVLDPRYKLIFANWQISQVSDCDLATMLQKKLFSCVKYLFEEYSDRMEWIQSESHETQSSECYGHHQFLQSTVSNGCSIDRYSYHQFLQSTESSGCSIDHYSYRQFLESSGPIKSELDKYMEESLETKALDILHWWRLNFGQFLVLANIARDVLAIPVTIVTSNSTFSTGGRVLDPYCNSLTPKIVETLICTQDWLKGAPLLMLTNKEFEKFKEGKMK